MANLRADNLCGTGFVSANDGTVWSDYITGSEGTLANYPATYGFNGNISNFVYPAVDGIIVWTPPNGGIKAERIEVYVYAGNTHPIVRVNGVSTGAVVGSATPNQLGNWVDVTDLVDGHLKTITCYGQEISSVDRQSGFSAVRINGEILVDGEQGRSGGREAIDGSVFFDGLSYLTCATSSDFALPGDFTLEMWWKNTGFNGGSHYVFTTKVSNSTPTFTVFINGSNGSLTVSGGSSGGSLVASSGLLTLVDGAWHHIAYTRSSGTNRVFVDGIVGATANSDSTTYTSQTNRPLIGSSNTQDSTHTAKGYISNLRLVKGTALYTASFTPPTEKLTAIDGTVLLCCQDSDNALQEATGKTITGYGNLASVGVNENLVTNGNFTAGTTGWDDSLAPSETTLSSENQRLKVVASGGTGRARQAVTGLTIGNRYKFQIRHVTCASGNCFTHLGTSDGGAEIVTNLGLGDEDLHTFYFTATTTTVYIQTGITIGLTGYFDDVSLTLAEQPKAPKVLPPVGVDPGVTFNGDTKVNTQNYMYFPTADTPQRGRGRGVIFAGESPSGPSSPRNRYISYVEIQSGGAAKDFGDLTKDCGETKAVGSSTRGVVQLSGDSPATIDTLEYVTFATTSNSIDFGDLNEAWWMRATAGSETRGIWAGGLYPGSTFKNEIDYITIATLGDALDFGDLTTARNAPTGCSSSTRMLVAGGQNGPATSDRLVTIEYITIATLGSAPDFGDLTVGGKELCSAASSTRGVFGPRLAAPGIVNTIDYVTIATLGDAVDFGDGVTVRAGAASLSNSIRGVWSGGYTPSLVNSMEYVDIATTGNAVNFGDITYVNQYSGGCSDSHGGLS